MGRELTKEIYHTQAHDVNEVMKAMVVFLQYYMLNNAPNMDYLIHVWETFFWEIEQKVNIWEIEQKLNYVRSMNIKFQIKRINTMDDFPYKFRGDLLSDHDYNFLTLKLANNYSVLTSMGYPNHWENTTYNAINICKSGNEVTSKFLQKSDFMTNVQFDPNDYLFNTSEQLLMKVFNGEISVCAPYLTFNDYLKEDK